LNLRVIAVTGIFTTLLVMPGHVAWSGIETHQAKRVAAMSLTAASEEHRAKMTTSQAPPSTSSSSTPDNELVDAARQADVPRMRQLLARGANANAVDEDGSTPLTAAMQSWRDVDFDLNADDDPDEASSTLKHKEAAQLLIDNGARVDRDLGDGYTLLMSLCIGGIVAPIKFLVEHGADVNAKDSKGKTPLFIASDRNRLKVCSYLVSKGAHVAVHDNDGDTPLTNIVGSHHHDDSELRALVKLFLDKGADPNSKDAFGHTALHIALDNGLKATAEILRQAGAKP
jgi:ankyrin repeat protein